MHYILAMVEHYKTSQINEAQLGAVLCCPI